jgi:hypothetical protein
MHGNNPARDSIENALSAACNRGQIHSWERLPGYGPHAKWQIRLNMPARGPQGDAHMEIRTYAEGHLVAAALASAAMAAPEPGALAGQLDEQLRHLPGGHVAVLDDGDLGMLDQLRKTIGAVLAAAGRLA